MPLTNSLLCSNNPSVNYRVKSTLLLYFLLSASLFSVAQMSDFISVKKSNGRTVKTFMPGNAIRLTTVEGRGFEGWITQIKQDSVFLKIFDIRTLPTQFGTTMVDTVGSYQIGLPYRDIFRIEVKDRGSFNFITNGTLFMIGGLGYAALNVINGAYLKEPLTDARNLTSLGIALGVAGGGYLLNRLDHKKQKAGKKYKIVYVRMSDPSIQKVRNS